MDIKGQLEERLISFSILVIEVVNYLPDNRVGNHLAGQLLRSGTSPALHCGKALGEESRKDVADTQAFILKELRGAHNCLRILSRINYITRNDFALLECHELISIFVKSVRLRQKNSNTIATRKLQIANVD